MGEGNARNYWPADSNNFVAGTIRTFSRRMCNGKRLILSSSLRTSAGRDAGYLIGLGGVGRQRLAERPGVLGDHHDLEVFILQVLPHSVVDLRQVMSFMRLR